MNALKELVVEQQLKLKEYLQYEEEDENKPQAKNFRFIIYNTEIERVQYLMKMYLRSRLKKVLAHPPRSSCTASTLSSTSPSSRGWLPPQKSSFCASTPK